MKTITPEEYLALKNDIRTVMQKRGYEPRVNGGRHSLVDMAAFAYLVKMGRGGVNGLLPEVPDFEKLPTELLDDCEEGDRIFTQIAEELAAETWPDHLLIAAVGGFEPGRRSALAIRRIAANPYGAPVLKALWDFQQAVGHCDNPTSEEAKLLAMRIADREGSTGIGKELEKHASDPWIPCASRMPENEEEVLIYIPGVGARTGYRDWEQGHNPEFWKCGGRRLELKDVTHWMPIPKGPKSCLK